mmetsp:Transcript_111726/g.176016  ORF Transcript_111726/g.176016 Transcript_111726/m.176016 type:complete len:213 (-) Transcript_111726:176-814(-)
MTNEAPGQVKLGNVLAIGFSPGNANKTPEAVSGYVIFSASAAECQHQTGTVVVFGNVFMTRTANTEGGTAAGTSTETCAKVPSSLFKKFHNLVRCCIIMILRASAVIPGAALPEDNSEAFALTDTCVFTTHVTVPGASAKTSSRRVVLVDGEVLGCKSVITFFASKVPISFRGTPVTSSRLSSKRQRKYVPIGSSNTICSASPSWSTGSHRP